LKYYHYTFINTINNDPRPGMGDFLTTHGSGIQVSPNYFSIRKAQRQNSMYHTYSVQQWVEIPREMALDYFGEAELLRLETEIQC